MVCGVPVLVVLVVAACAVGGAAATATGMTAAMRAAAGRIRRIRMDLPGSVEGKVHGFERMVRDLDRRCALVRSIGQGSFVGKDFYEL
jgi:sugar (pentulose or hexulose) kinase